LKRKDAKGLRRSREAREGSEQLSLKPGIQETIPWLRARVGLIRPNRMRQQGAAGAGPLLAHSSAAWLSHPRHPRNPQLKGLEGIGRDPVPDTPIL